MLISRRWGATTVVMMMPSDGACFVPQDVRMRA